MDNLVDPAEQSGEGRRGIPLYIGVLLGYCVVIGLAFGVSYVLVNVLGPALNVNLGFLQLIGWFTLAVYILNELTSIVENLLVLGYDVPKILVRGLAVARSAVDAAGNKIVPDPDKGEEGKGNE